MSFNKYNRPGKCYYLFWGADRARGIIALDVIPNGQCLPGEELVDLLGLGGDFELLEDFESACLAFACFDELEI